MKQRILVVDDETDLSDLISFNLKLAGYDVCCARDGLEGVDRARSFHPDLILLDLMLPMLDGFAVCEILREGRDTAHIPIIMLTAWSSEMSRSLGLQHGAVDYLTKPFRTADLVGRIGGILSRRTAPACIGN